MFVVVERWHGHHLSPLITLVASTKTADLYQITFSYYLYMGKGGNAFILLVLYILLLNISQYKHLSFLLYHIRQYTGFLLTYKYFKGVFQAVALKDLNQCLLYLHTSQVMREGISGMGWCSSKHLQSSSQAHTSLIIHSYIYVLITSTATTLIY